MCLFKTANLSRNNQIMIAETNATINEPPISKGKCMPQNTLANPPIKPIAVRTQPIVLVDLKNNSSNANDNIRVVWSEGKDVSSA